MEPELRRTSAGIAFVATLVASIALASAVFLPLWKPILLAAILATASYGPYRRLTGRLGGRRRLSAGVMTVALVLLVLLPVAVVVSVAVREAIEAFELVQRALQRGGIEELTHRLPERLEGLARRLLEELPAAAERLPQSGESAGVTVARVAGDVMSGISRVLFAGAMMLIAYFGFLTEGERLLGWLADAFPLRRRHTLELFREFRTVSRSVLRSVVLTAAAQAVVAAIGYLIAGVPQTVFFGFLTFFAAFVPSLGTGIVALPLAIVLLLVGDTWQGIFLLAWALLAVGLVDNLLKPLLVRGGTQLEGILVFFALIGGILAFGPIGLLVGPLAVAFLLAMVRFGRREWRAPAAAEEPELPT